MTSPSPDQRPQDNELLVHAYLDGELDAAATLAACAHWRGKVDARA